MEFILAKNSQTIKCEQVHYRSSTVMICFATNPGVLIELCYQANCIEFVGNTPHFI